MQQPFQQMLTVGGKTNSLGRVDEVIQLALSDTTRLDELYACLFSDDAWVRMRAADALEKICRVHPDWIAPYIDKFQGDLAVSTQPSIQWHIAQIYRQVRLTPQQKQIAINWLEALLATTSVDWIVAANAMETLHMFVQDGSVSKTELRRLATIQQRHHAKSVVRRASKLLAALDA
jgi:TPR repeat protein